MQADHHLTELMLCAPLEREAVLFWSVSGSNQIGGPRRAHILIATGWGMVGVGVGGDRPGDRTAWVDEKTTTFAIEPFGGGHQEVSWDGSGRGHRSEPILEAMEQQHARYWRRVLRLTGVLLGVWFVAGLGAGVLFKEDFSVLRAALVPHAVVAERASYVEATNSWRLLLKDDIWNCSGVVDVTTEIAAAARNENVANAEGK